VERPEAGAREIIAELSDARFVEDRRPWLRRARERLCWIFAARTVHLIQISGPSSEQGEMALGQDVLVALMTREGYN
jgi:hypothetical protein